MVVTLAQQYNIGKKPYYVVYTYINRQHGETPDKNKTKTCVLVYHIYSCRRSNITNIRDNNKTAEVNPSRETKFLDANGDKKMLTFPVQLATSRISKNLTRLVHTLLCM